MAQARPGAFLRRDLSGRPLMCGLTQPVDHSRRPAALRSRHPSPSMQVSKVVPDGLAPRDGSCRSLSSILA